MGHQHHTKERGRNDGTLVGGCCFIKTRKRSLQKSFAYAQMNTNGVPKPGFAGIEPKEPLTVAFIVLQHCSRQGDWQKKFCKRCARPRCVKKSQHLTHLWLSGALVFNISLPLYLFELFASLIFRKKRSYIYTLLTCFDLFLHERDAARGALTVSVIM